MAFLPFLFPSVYLSDLFFLVSIYSLVLRIFFFFYQRLGCLDNIQNLGIVEEINFLALLFGIAYSSWNPLFSVYK